MKYIKTPVYEFSELNSEAQDRIRQAEHDSYWETMWLDDLDLFLFDRDDCPLVGSGVAIDSHKDLSIDVSYDRYDHVTFRSCVLDLQVILNKSGAYKLIEESMGTDIKLNVFIDNLVVHWEVNGRDLFCSSGEIVVGMYQAWEDLFVSEKDSDEAYALEDKVANYLTDYMHSLQYKLMQYLRDLSWEAAEYAADNLDPDLVYDAQGNSYSCEEVEEE